MPRHTLYAYTEGSNLNGIADELEASFRQFVENAAWRLESPWVVNHRREDDPSLGPGDLPDWELGLNLNLPDPGHEPSGWFADVERIATFLGHLQAHTGRDFVIGIGDNERGYSEDLFFVNQETPDLRALRQIIGVKDEIG